MRSVFSSACHCAFSIILLSGCASATDRLEDAGCGELTPVAGTGSSRICVSEALPATVFSSAVLADVRIEARPVASSSSSMAGRPAGTRYPVGPQQKKELEQLTRDSFAAALSERNIEQADSAGPGVVVVRGEILDVLFEVPTDPDSGAKYLLDPVARATFVVRLTDATSGAVLLHAFADRSAEPGSEDAHTLDAIAALWQALLLETLNYLPAPKDDVG